MSNPIPGGIPSDAAVDLDKYMQDKKVRDEAALKAAQEKALERVRSWDKAMQRAFKGIVPRPTRHRMINEALREAEARADG